MKVRGYSYVSQPDTLSLALTILVLPSGFSHTVIIGYSASAGKSGSPHHLLSQNKGLAVFSNLILIAITR